MKKLLIYLGNLGTGKTVLWFYLIWYCVMAGFYFDPRIRLWVNSLGISIVIGTGLVLSVLPAGGIRAMERWQLARLFMMPFCVSSFAALIKDQGFIVIISPRVAENLVAAGSCATFFAIVILCKFMCKRPQPAA